MNNEYGFRIVYTKLISTYDVTFINIARRSSRETEQISNNTYVFKTSN